MSIITDIEKRDGTSNITKYDGYSIKFDNNNYLQFKINNERCSGEEWNVWSEDDRQLNKFVGSTIIGISVKVINEKKEYGYTECCITFTIKTNKGFLKLFIFNQHNGYYSHECIIDYNIIIDGKHHKKYKSFNI